mmetsp:Transcript_16233/g.35523  ORF Transcript_16233/g.35523 Transcript_16233/m.35523 type:complete len:258 (-) Transcript_16233:215-988(-)
MVRIFILNEVARLKASPDIPLMPWTRSWQVPVFIFSGILSFVIMLSIIVNRSTGASRRFGRFYRGDISAFLAESWQLSVFGLPPCCIALFMGCLFRHPLHSPTGDIEIWNLMAVIILTVACVAMVGLTIVTQTDCTGTSSYRLQSSVCHGVFLFLFAFAVFAYEGFHVFALSWDIMQRTLPLGRVAMGVAVIESLLLFASLANVAGWVAESSKEEFPDDPKCCKRNEWIWMLCTFGFLTTLPVLTCFSDPSFPVKVS